MSYDREPPWTQRFRPDGTVIPAESTPLVWPSIAWLVSPPVGQGRGPVEGLVWEACLVDSLDLRAEAPS